MSSLTQYLNLYRDNSEAIDRGSAGALNDSRAEALKRLEAPDCSLPTKADEGYERTSIDAMMSPDFGVNVNRVNIPVDVAATFRCGVPHMTTLLGITVNDSFVSHPNVAERLPEGLTFMSLGRAAKEMPELVSHYYNKIADRSTSESLNTLLAQDGVFIHVARGVKVARPLQLVNIFSSPVPLLGIRRVLIVLEEDASLQLLTCDHTQTADISFMASQVVEVSLGRGASLDLCDIEESSKQTSRHSMMTVNQAARSRLNAATVTLTCGTTRNEVKIRLLGENAETFLAGMAIGDGTMHIDNDTRVDHLSPKCKSNQLYKYALDGESSGAFEGTIMVAEGAKNTEAYQSNRNVIASHGARMHTKPQLEIYNDDVRCSHGATTGQLDNAALFYMQTRGIPEQEARTMLMQAFMVDVIDTVSIDGMRDRLRHLVDNRFSHNHGEDCGDCAGTTCRHFEPKQV